MRNGPATDGERGLKGYSTGLQSKVFINLTAEPPPSLIGPDMLHVPQPTEEAALNSSLELLPTGCPGRGGAAEPSPFLALPSPHCVSPAPCSVRARMLTALQAPTAGPASSLWVFCKGKGSAVPINQSLHLQNLSVGCCLFVFWKCLK